MNAAAIANTLSRNGQTVTIVGTISATYDPATGSASATAYSGSASAVILPLNPYRAQVNSIISAGDEQMLLSALVGRPPLGSVVTLADGVTKYTLIAVEPLHPAGAELLWDCIVRGSAP